MQVLVVAEQAAGVPAPAVAQALVGAWQRRRPDDGVTVLCVSDGGAGLLDSLARAEDTWLVTEVAGPHGHPVEAALLVRPDGTAVVEAARATASELAPDGVAFVMRATTYGVGELLQAAKDADARRVLVGVADTAAVDGGAGALTALGFRLRVEDGSGLKIGADDLDRITSVEPGWSEDWSDLEVVVLTDRPATLREACEELPADVTVAAGDADRLESALRTWGEVAGRDLEAVPVTLRPGSGAGGGLAFGLAAALHADLRPAEDMIWDVQDGPTALAGADLVLIAAGETAAAHAAAQADAAGVRSATLPPLDLASVPEEDRLDALETAAARAISDVP